MINEFKMSLYKKKKINAFTLAEVLITLGIIGIVAAMTIPNLITNYQKTQYVTSLKKAYTEFNQALAKASADSGCVNDLKCSGLFAGGTNNLSLGTTLVKYFNTAKICENSIDKGCWPLETNQYYDGSNTVANRAFDKEAFYKFVTTDGISFAMGNYGNNCETPGYSTGSTGNMSQTCGFLYIDVNGLKKPNAIGRDTFMFWITNGRGGILYPHGGSDANWNGFSVGNSWWKNSSNVPRHCLETSKTGTHCAGRVIEEGWQMNY